MFNPYDPSQKSEKPEMCVCVCVCVCVSIVSVAIPQVRTGTMLAKHFACLESLLCHRLDNLSKAVVARNILC